METGRQEPPAPPRSAVRRRRLLSRIAHWLACPLACLLSEGFCAPVEIDAMETDCLVVIRPVAYSCANPYGWTYPRGAPVPQQLVGLLTEAQWRRLLGEVQHVGAVQPWLPFVDCLGRLVLGALLVVVVLRFTLLHPVGGLPVYVLVTLFSVFFASQLFLRISRARFSAALFMVLSRSAPEFARALVRLDISFPSGGRHTPYFWVERMVPPAEVARGHEVVDGQPVRTTLAVAASDSPGGGEPLGRQRPQPDGDGDGDGDEPVVMEGVALTIEIAEGGVVADESGGSGSPPRSRPRPSGLVVEGSLVRVGNVRVSGTRAESDSEPAPVAAALPVDAAIRRPSR